MSDVAVYAIKNFDKFINWLFDTSKFYARPKFFIERLAELEIKTFTRNILQYFILFESILLVISSTLIDKIQFGLYKIPGLLLLDLIFAFPLVLIISFSLFISKVENPIKKSISFVFLFKIFYGLPIQIFFFLFVFFENYVYYILFGAGLQLLIIVLVILPSIFFAERTRQMLVILVTTLGLFLLFVFLYTQVSSLNPSTEGLEDYDFYFDPIFSEYRRLRVKAKLIDEIEDIENYRKFISKDNFEKDLQNLKDDQKYYNELIFKSIALETDFFNNKENYNFESNKRRFENYLEFLNKLSYFHQEYYTRFEIFIVEKQIKKNQDEMDIISKEVNELPEYEISDFGELNLSNLNHDEIVRVLEERAKKIELATDKQKLMIDVKNKEISILRNRNKIQKIKLNIMNKANELEDSRLQFAKQEHDYYFFIVRLNNFLFIL